LVIALPLVQVATKDVIQTAVGSVEDASNPACGVGVGLDLGYGLGGGVASGSDASHCEGFDVAHFEQRKIALGCSPGTLEERGLLNGRDFRGRLIAFERSKQA
jgi:hypothetical protein